MPRHKSDKHDGMTQFGTKGPICNGPSAWRFLKVKPDAQARGHAQQSIVDAWNAL